MIKKSLVVAKYSVLEMLRSKVMVMAIILAVALLLVTYVASQFTYGSTDKVALDFGLGLTSLSMALISLLFGNTLVAKEIQDRTIYMLVTKDMTRSSYLLGRLLGIALIVFIDLVLLAAVTLTLYGLLGGVFSPMIFWTLLFTFFESLLLIFLGVLFSLLVNPILSSIFVLSLYITGHSAQEVLLSRFAGEGLTKSILKIFLVIFPDFNRLNLKDFVLYEQNISLSYFLSNSAYVGLYLLGLFVISSWIFERKNLD